MPDGSAIDYFTAAWHAITDDPQRLGSNLYDSWECEDSPQYENELREMIETYDKLYKLMDDFAEAHWPRTDLSKVKP